MNKKQLKRLIKIEDRVHQIALDMGLDFNPIEFDVVPAQKMLEIMAYNIPTNISNWKFGRDYEMNRTIYEHMGSGLPYEVVISDENPRAYLMETNTLPVQVLVIAHVYGHAAFAKMNQWFQRVNYRKNIIEYMYQAQKRFNKYEAIFGIDEVEKTIDAAHALQLNMDPFDLYDEEEKRKRLFEAQKKRNVVSKSDFDDLDFENSKEIDKENVNLHNSRLWHRIKNKIPVQPTQNILSFIVNYSDHIDDWQRDILETIIAEGKCYWPIMRTKTINEGFATFIHNKIMMQLFKEGLLKTEEHADFNYSNSLVISPNPYQINPYHLGYKMLCDIEERWNKGRHGDDWNEETKRDTLKEWNSEENEGLKKILSIVKTHNDWMFVNEFLTYDLIKELKLYTYMKRDAVVSYDYVITDDDAKAIKEAICKMYINSSIPKIFINAVDDAGKLVLNHDEELGGRTLDKEYALKTMEHIRHLWGRKVSLSTLNESGKSYITWLSH